MSPAEPAPYINMNGKIVGWNEGLVHVYAPAVKYGAGVFEGLRGYWNEEHQRMYVFRLHEHLERLTYTQRMMGLERIIPPEELAQQTLELLSACAFTSSVHIRVSVYLDGLGETYATGPVSYSIAAVPRPPMKVTQNGANVQVSSWRRMPDESAPMRVKANANYLNSRYAGMQARRDGYDSAILLNTRGKVSEGPAMCLFIIRNGQPITPGVSSDILESITRETVMVLLSERFGLSTIERDVDRSELYAAQEAFFCGTAWEVTPVVGIDGQALGEGNVGSITKQLQEVYFDVVTGKDNQWPEWRTPVPETQ